MSLLLESGASLLHESGDTVQLETFIAPPRVLPTYNGTVRLIGKPATFGVKQNGLTLGGKIFQLEPIDTWLWGAGQSSWFPAVMSDGQVIIPGQPFTATSFSKTAADMEYVAWNPTTQTATVVQIPTTTGHVSVLSPFSLATGGADIEDSQAMFLKTGEEICLMISGRPYDNWNVATYGYYPGIVVLEKDPTGNWVYDPIRSKTAPQLQAGNTADDTANSTYPVGTNSFGETFYSVRNFSEMSAPMPHSRCIAIGKYDDKTGVGQRSGVLTILDPETMTIQTSFLIPNVSDSEGSPLGLHVREVQSDPSSNIDDERITVIYDPFYTGASTTPLYTNDFEAGVTGWTSLFGTSTITSSTTLAHAGTHSIKMVATTANQSTVIGPTAGAVPVVGNGRYLVSGWFRPDDAGTGLSVQMGAHWLNAAGTQVGSASGSKFTSTVGSWVQATATLTAPALATQFIPVANVYTTAIGQIMFGDDFQMVASNSGSPKFAVQEFAYQASTQTLTAKSAPVFPTDLKRRYETMCFDHFGNLYIGEVVSPSAFGQYGGVAVYLKRANGERAYVSDVAVDAGWVAGGTTSQWGVLHQPDYTVPAQNTNAVTPVGMFFDEARSILVIPTKTGQVEALKIGRVGGHLQFTVPFQPFDVDLSTLTGNTGQSASMTKPTYDPVRALMHWPVRGNLITPSPYAAETFVPYVNNQWLFTINLGSLLETINVQPLSFTVDITDRRRQFLVDTPDSRRRLILDA